MTDTDNSEREPWMDSPLMVDHPEGFTHEESILYQLQIKQPYGGWEPFSNARKDRDEVTGIQAYHLNNHPGEPPLRVWKRTCTWTLDEVPGNEAGQTPPEEILARNDAITERLLATENTQESAPQGG